MATRRAPKPGELYCWECGKLSAQVVKLSDGRQLCLTCPTAPPSAASSSKEENYG